MADSVAGSARWSWRLAGVAGTVFVVGPLAAHLYLVPAMAGFVLFALGGLLGLIAAIVSLIGVLRHGGPSRAVAGRALVLAGVVTLVFLLIAGSAGDFPRINDITTDTQSPPQFVAARDLPANRGRDMAYPGAEFAAQQEAGYPDLAPLALPGTPDEVYRRVEATARRMSTWEITRADPQAHVVEGTDTTRLFRFQDDFVIEVRAADGGSVVQMRSKSRDGKGDIGANAARIERFFAALQAGS